MWALLTLAQIDWLDTWKEMERLYKTYPDKLKAIGEPRSPHLPLTNPYPRRLQLLRQVPGAPSRQLHGCPGR